MSEAQEIHSQTCKYCPSAHYPSDPESEDMIRFYREGSLTWDELTFPCAWRPEKLCKGICDQAAKATQSIAKETK